MTFDELVAQVAEDLNLTSTDAFVRIGKHINVKYRELLAKPWLQISRRGTIAQMTTPASQFVTFPVTKLYNVFDQLNFPNNPLSQYAVEEIRSMTPLANPPDAYAIFRAGAGSVTILTNGIPATPVQLTADAELKVVTLKGTEIPGFNEDFHDILYYGAKYLELLKLEKADLAGEANTVFEQRLSDLKFHIAKTSYLNYLQGKDAAQGPPAFVNTLIPG